MICVVSCIVNDSSRHMVKSEVSMIFVTLAEVNAEQKLQNETQLSSQIVFQMVEKNTWYSNVN